MKHSKEQVRRHPNAQWSDFEGIFLAIFTGYRVVTKKRHSLHGLDVIGSPARLPAVTGVQSCIKVCIPAVGLQICTLGLLSCSSFVAGLQRGSTYAACLYIILMHLLQRCSCLHWQHQVHHPDHLWSCLLVGLQTVLDLARFVDFLSALDCFLVLVPCLPASSCKTFIY